MTDTHLAERLRGLIERLEKAEAGSRELDWLIAEALGDIPEHRIMEVGWDYNWFRRSGEFALWKATDSEGRSVELWQAPQRSTSLDAAVALVERVRPGWSWQIRVNVTTDGDDRYTNARVWAPTGPRDDSSPTYWANGPDRTPAIVLVIATLRALSQEQSK